MATNYTNFHELGSGLSDLWPDSVLLRVSVVNGLWVEVIVMVVFLTGLTGLTGWFDKEEESYTEGTEDHRD